MDNETLHTTFKFYGTLEICAIWLLCFLMFYIIYKLLTKLVIWVISSLYKKLKICIILYDIALEFDLIEGELSLAVDKQRIWKSIFCFLKKQREFDNEKPEALADHVIDEKIEEVDTSTSDDSDEYFDYDQYVVAPAF